MKRNFNPVYLTSTRDVEEAVKDRVNDSRSYFLILNEWDKPCDYYLDQIKNIDTSWYNENVFNLYVIDIFNVPNVLEVIRASIKSSKETMSTSALSNYSNLPMLVVLHKAFPRVVTYNGSISAELGI